MFDPIFCNACGETNDIGGLIGELTNDCPNCARPVLLKQQPAHQGGYQPAIITGLATLLEAGDTFTSSKNHIDFPNQLLCIPDGCVGFVEKYLYHETDGTVSILRRDTITARRLIERTAQTQFIVSANEDRVKKIPQLEKLLWEAVYMSNAVRWNNKVKVCFSDREEALKLYNLLVSKDCSPGKDWS